MRVRTQVDIQRPNEAVFAFASNIASLPPYNKGILEARKITPGSIRAGSIFRLTAIQFGLRMTARLMITAYEANKLFAYQVTSGPFPVETRYILKGSSKGTRIDAKREPQVNGLMKWLIPLATNPARRKLHRELASLNGYLERHT